MVGFWRKIEARTRDHEEPGPGQPFPDIYKTKYTWPSEMTLLEPPSSSDIGLSTSYISPLPISRIWQPVSPSDGDMDGEMLNVPYNSCFQGF